ncbi:hypothetical protein [Rhodanobacter lindaniclasticus]
MDPFDMFRASMTPAQRAAPVNMGELVDSMAKTLVLLKKLDSRLAAFADRLNIVEAKGITYTGTYQRSAEYKRGDFATHKGSMWHAVRQTQDEPGVSNAWQLAVKAGRDGSNRK